MKRYNNLLVVVEPKRSKQVALTRALEMARYNRRINITLLRLVYDFSYDIHILNRLREKDARSDILRSHEEQVSEIIKTYTEDLERVPEIRTKVVFTRDIAEGIISEMRNGDYHLVLKAANHHGVLDAIIFTPIDWYLLRNADIPVVIAKDHAWGAGAAIVVAANFSNSARMQTNLTLLREAQEIASITKGAIHLVNSAALVQPSVMLEIPHYSPDNYSENVLTEQRERLYRFAAAHDIPQENCHIAEGMPDDVIPDVCRQVGAAVVLIGSAGRSGAMAALMGNTCEEIVDYIDADLIVINRRTIAKAETVSVR